MLRKGIKMARKKLNRQDAAARTANVAGRTARGAARLGTRTANLAAGTVPVLLCEDIEKLGWLGDVVEVRMGYARNYLIPQGLAKVATQSNIKAIADERDHRAQERKSERVKLEEAAKAVEGAEAVVAAKANEQGHLFGSVTAREIAANLRAQGFEVPDDAVQLGGGPDGHRGHSGGIKEVGTHTVSLKFAEDLSCQVSVVVVAEQAGTANLAAEVREAEER